MFFEFQYLEETRNISWPKFRCEEKLKLSLSRLWNTL